MWPTEQIEFETPGLDHVSQVQVLAVNNVSVIYLLLLNWQRKYNFFLAFKFVTRVEQLCLSVSKANPVPFGKTIVFEVSATVKTQFSKFDMSEMSLAI